MNNLLEYKGFYGNVELSETDNILFGKVMGINGLISYEGDNVVNLKADFINAVDEYLEICADKNVEPEKSYGGSLNIRLSPDLHKTLAFYSISHGRSLDSTVEEAIKCFVS